jgi:glycosyltransferase involved in cell wall biosynthesis
MATRRAAARLRCVRVGKFRSGPKCNMNAGLVERMRILVDSRYVRERPSGIGAYVEALIARLPALAPDLDFLLWTHRHARRPLSVAANVREAVVEPEPNSLWTLLWPDRYGPLEAVDVFHAAHTVLPRRLTMATVVTIHDLLALEMPHLHRDGWDGAIKRLYYPGAVWRGLKRATRLITTTSAMADRVLRLWPDARARTVVIPLATDRAFCAAVDRPAVQRRVERLLGASFPYFLVVGQNSATKRHADALRAFAAAAPVPWRLVLLQRQSLGNPLAALAASLKIADRVIWLPGVDRADLVTLLQGAGALLQPSAYEGFGLPVVEAMACGCPAIVSDLPTLREVVAGTAIRVPPGDVDALAASVALVSGSVDLRSELSARGLERSAAFSWDRCAADTLAVYRDAAAEGGQRSFR